jgi:hypothetical protein
MGLPVMQLNLSPHAVNAIHSALQHSIGTLQNALNEVQMETQAWQAAQQAAQLAAQHPAPPLPDSNAAGSPGAQG